MSLKDSVARLASGPRANAVLRRLTMENRAIVFGMHRFGPSSSQMESASVTELTRRLEFLRARGYQLVDLHTLVQRATSEDPEPQPKGSAPLIAFTVDDGYADFAEHAAPVFKAFDCPVTVFVTTGFIDGMWLWWDQVDYLLAAGRADVLALGENGDGPRWDLKRVPPNTVYRQVLAHLKTLRASRFARSLELIQEQVGVELPDSPPPGWAPMSWSEIQSLNGDVTTFAPHTVHHPILANAEEAQARREVTSSLERLQAQVGEVCPVFAYPDGGPASFGAREMRIVEECGLAGAVTTVQDYWDLADVARNQNNRFALPRFSFAPEWNGFVQIIAGIEWIKSGVRRRFGRS